MADDKFFRGSTGPRTLRGMGLALSVDDWPLPLICTERLALRAPRARDRDEFLDLGSDDEVNRHLGGGRDRGELEAELPEVQP